MKTLMIAALTVFILSLGAAVAEPASNSAPPQAGNQVDWTVGGAGWG